MTRSLTLLSLFFVSAVASGLAIHGCSEGTKTLYVSQASVVQITSDTAVGLKPTGPDAIGGAGSDQAGDIGDFVLMNQHLKVVVDQPGDDPTSLGGAFPLSNLLAPTGGTLVDVASRTYDNDQWLQSGHGVVGLVTVIANGTVGTALDATAGGPAFVDPTRDFPAEGVAVGDTLVITSGLNAGRSYRIGLIPAANTLGLFVPPGFPYQTDSAPPPGSLTYQIVHRTSPLSNLVVYDTATVVQGSGDPAVLRVTGSVLNANLNEIPDGATVNPANLRLQVGGTDLVVETDYQLFRDAKYLTLETRLENPGGGAVGITSLAEVVITGGIGEPNIAPWTPLVGFEAQGLDSPVIVPFASFQGRDEPGVSYTLFDQQVGQVIVASDGQFATAVVQLSTATSLASGATLTWLRHLAVGDHNDVASSADTAIALLANSPVRTNPATGGTIPNGFEGLSYLGGTVRGGPPGTTITAIQVTPGLVFDAGAPNGLSAAPGFYSSTLYGAAELLVSQARPRADGSFLLAVPRTFAGLSPTATASPDLVVPTGFENGTTATRWRLLVEAPGHDPQSVIVTVPTDFTNNLFFDLLGETGTIELEVTDDTGAPVPARVLVIGMDPDGAGPTAPTPDPNFGAAGTNVQLPRATGKDNLVHLIDGRGSVKVAPGAYQVIASRGLEYSAARFPDPSSSVDFFLVAAGQTVRTETAGVPMQLTRVLDSTSLPDPGGGTFSSPLREYVSTDYHVHAGGSFDSPVPTRDRVASYLASGLEVMVSTEHDKIVDYGPAIADLDDETTLDLDELIVSQVGVESTGFVGANVPGVLVFPNTIGHVNAWPLAVQPALRRNGAPADEYRSPAELYEQLRTLNAVVIQMNHPRFPILEPPLPPIGLGFFTNGKAGVGFDQPFTGIAALAGGGYDTPLRTVTSGGDGGIDDLNVQRPPTNRRYNEFDVLEVYGGNLTLYDINRLDWYALLSAGYVRTGTANSDSHGLSGEPAFPRNFVRSPGDGSADVGAVDLDLLTEGALPSLVQAASGTHKPLSVELFPAAERAGGGADDMDVLGSAGPVVFIEIDANEDGTFDGGVGDLIADDGDNSVDVRVTVIAAPWVPVDSVTIIVNGGNAGGLATGLNPNSFSVPALDIITPTGGDFSTSLTDVVRLREVYTIALPDNNPAATGQDHWIIAEVRGAPGAGSVVYDLLLPAIGTAVGFTNPVFINTNNDADWDPPGVP